MKYSCVDEHGKSVESIITDQIPVESIVQISNSIAKNIKLQSSLLSYSNLKLNDNKNIVNGSFGYIEYKALKTNLKYDEKYYHLIAKDVVKNVNLLIDQLERNPILKKLGFVKYTSADEFAIYDNAFEHEFGSGDSDFAEIKIKNFKIIDNSVNEKKEKDLLSNIYSTLSKNKTIIDEMFDNQIFDIFAKLGLKKASQSNTTITKVNTKSNKCIKISSSIECTGFKNLKHVLEKIYNTYFEIRWDVLSKNYTQIRNSVTKIVSNVLQTNGIKLSSDQINSHFTFEKFFYVDEIKTLRQLEKETADKPWGGYRFGSDEEINKRFTFDIDKNTIKFEICVFI